jgi:hypothetical protein
LDRNCTAHGARELDAVWSAGNGGYRRILLVVAHSGEGPLDQTDNGRSAIAAGTAFRALKRTVG